MADPTKDDLENQEKVEKDQDIKYAEWLAQKVGPKLAQAIVFGSGLDDEDIEKELDKKHAEWLAMKVGPELAQAIVYGSGMEEEDIKKGLQKLGITNDVIRDYISDL